MANEVKAYARDILKTELTKICTHYGFKLHEIAANLGISDVSMSRILNRAHGASPACIKGMTDFINEYIEGGYKPDELFYYGGAEDADEW